MKLNSLLHILDLPLLRFLRVASFWLASLLLWGVVLFLLYNLFYGKDGVLEYISLSNEIAKIRDNDRISDIDRKRMEKEFQLTDQNGKPIEIWEL